MAEPGHHRRVLMARTGLDAQENQARRLLNDIAGYRGHLERVKGGPAPEVVASNKWLAEVYERVVRAIPDDLRDRLDEVAGRPGGPDRDRTAVRLTAPATIGDMYERFAREYAAHAEDSPYNAFYDRPAVLGLLGDVAGRTVFDAACGPGLYASELLERGARVLGCDESPTFVAMARDRTAGRADLRVHDLADPLAWVADGSVDLVVLALALHYIDDRTALLRELRRILAPAGALVLSTEHPMTAWLRLGGSYFTTEPVEESLSPDYDWPIRAWRRPLTVTCAEFREAGFLIEELLEPRPAPGMADRYPEEHTRLSEAPAFIAFRLVPDR